MIAEKLAGLIKIIETNQYCPFNRIDKTAKGPQQ